MLKLLTLRSQIVISRQPSSQPSCQPSRFPTSQPSQQPSEQPTMVPSQQPSSQPSAQPQGRPSGQPSMQPSSQPSRQPSCQPTMLPSNQPSTQPSLEPSSQVMRMYSTGGLPLPMSYYSDSIMCVLWRHFLADFITSSDLIISLHSLSIVSHIVAPIYKRCNTTIAFQ